MINFNNKNIKLVIFDLDGTLIASTSNIYNITGWDNSGTWASYTYVEAGTKSSSLTFYASSADNSGEATPKVHYWGNSVAKTEYPGVSMEKTSDDVTFLGSSLYRLTINYTLYRSDFSDIQINMIISNNGDYNKSSNITVINDGYYYSPSNGHWWNQGVSDDASKGAAAAVAFAISDADTCSLTEEKALQLRNDMETNEAHLSSATWETTKWGTITYTQALKWIDSFCAKSSQKYNSNTTVYQLSSESENNDIMLVAIISVVTLAAVGGFFLLKKKSSVR